MQQLSEDHVGRYMRQELSCKYIRRYMCVWIKQELMPAIERAAMEWLDNDVMPHVHWEALQKGFQSDIMYKPKRPRQPSDAPPPHLLERALKKPCSGMDSGSGMASGSGSGSAGGHGSCSGMTVEPESHMDTKNHKFMPPSAKAPSKIIAPEPMGQPKIFTPPETMTEAQDVKPFEPLRHTALDVKEEEGDKKDDADMDVKKDKVAEQDINKAIDKDFEEFLWKDVEEEEEAEEEGGERDWSEDERNWQALEVRQQEADKVREAEEEEEDREEEEDKTMDRDGHEGNGDQVGNDDQEPEHGELELTSEERERVQAEVECFALARRDVKDCLKRRIKMVYPPGFSSRSDADGLE